MPAPTETENVSSHFVDLDRRFVPVAEAAEREETASSSYLWDRPSGGLAWDKLLKKRLVVALGEPGSGKTEEFRQQARRMNSEGHVAFFVRLDELIATTLRETLGQEVSRKLDSWIIRPDRRWDNPAGGRRLTFSEVVSILEAKATELATQQKESKQVSVVAIDFRRPGEK
ncbi:MAG: hypothetical protein ABIZ49_00710 [Opitutaceae bacterium]